ncbi:FprA family A-type flavoprotein [uncultured Victivallis sp.]|uniref:FprA family A-type flavoprotein n=1 Tax=Victivallis sp. TaxID=2049020 RepID=UPI0025E51B5F|nr:FprA family A-type flavoprotein [uncultured Victivallis sp.]
MKEVFKAEQIAENVYWVGAVDWNVRNFHGYQTGRGSTYNAFLVIDEKVTLIDTVKAPFFNEMLARIRSVIDPEKIDYIISNHAEPDHSGAIVSAIEAIHPEKVFASPLGEKALRAYYGADLDLTVVKTGESVKLGKGTFSFIETKMLHWPDSMVTYLDTAKMLFSQDAFGMHLAGSKLWADEYPEFVLDYEGRKYFANILNVQSAKVLDLLNALPGLNLDIAVIAPDHGPLWRKNLGWILDLYRDCAEQKPAPRALVAYSTMWHSTEKLANAIADGIRSTGVTVEVADLAVNDRSAIMTEVARSGALAFGAPTMNNQMFPAMADVLTYIKGLRPKNKLGLAFGSFGWSGEGAKQIAAELEAMNIPQPVPMFQVKYMPTEADLEKAFESGAALGRALLASVAESTTK